MSDIDVVERVYEAYAAQDLDGLLALSDPACVITQDPALPWGGRYVGHEGVTAFAFALGVTVDAALSVESLFEADGQVIECGRSRGTVRATGQTFDVPEIHLWTVKDGKVTAAHFALDTPTMLSALAGPGSDRPIAGIGGLDDQGQEGIIT
jgi:uncharacterized protein